MDICDAALVCAAWNVKAAAWESVRGIYIFFQEQIVKYVTTQSLGNFMAFQGPFFKSELYFYFTSKWWSNNMDNKFNCLEFNIRNSIKPELNPRILFEEVW